MVKASEDPAIISVHAEVIPIDSMVESRPCFQMDARGIVFDVSDCLRLGVSQEVGEGNSYGAAL